MCLTETENITVYPVPFDNTLSVEIENLQGFSRTFVIKLKELTGYELFSSSLVVNANNISTHNETTTSVNKGMYILQVYEGTTLLDSRLVMK